MDKQWMRSPVALSVRAVVACCCCLTLFLVGGLRAEQQQPASGHGGTAVATMTKEALPLEPYCWEVLGDVISGTLSAQADGEDGGGAEGGLADCTAAAQEAADGPTQCCGALLAAFGSASPMGGCLCLTSFFSTFVISAEEILGRRTGVDVDLYLWTERCPQLGYAIPVAGNNMCPQSLEESPCDTQAASTSAKEADALLQLMWSNASALQSWTRDSHVCCWEGVECDQDGRVISLELREDVGLVGTLPEDFSALSHLQIISLPQGNLSGSLPGTWSHLAHLHSLISGRLPPELSEVRGLDTLLLAGNSLTGPLPEQYSVFQTAALTLDLQGNRLTGTLPSTWSKITAAKRINLSENNLSGSLPADWSTMERLASINFARNDALQGTLPPEWSAMRNVLSLTVSNAQINGPLPSQWSTLTSLQGLWLGQQYLTGTVPVEWSALTKLSHLSLMSNLLTGSLPPEWSALHLNTFFVSNNWLTGSMPDCWAPDAGLASLGEGFLDFRVNYFSAAPDGYEAVDNMYNCLPGVDGQRVCSPAWQPMAMLAVLLLCVSVALLSTAAASGWRALLSDLRFAVRRIIKTRPGLYCTKGSLLLVAALSTLSQRLFVISPMLGVAGVKIFASFERNVDQVAGEGLRLLSRNIASVIQPVPLFFLVVAFLVRGLLALAPRPEWLPQSVAVQAWTVVASEDVLRDNLRTLRIDQLLLLTVFLGASVVVPLVVSLGLPEVIVSREVDPSFAWGVNINTVRLVHLPRGMLALLTGSFIISIYSMLSAVLLPGAVVWPSVAVNEAIRACGSGSKAEQSLRQLRRLRWMFPLALLSLVLCAASIGLFVAADWHDTSVGAQAAQQTSGMKLFWGTAAEAGAIAGLVALQLLSIAGWNASIWRSSTCCVTATVETLSTTEPESDAENVPVLLGDPFALSAPIPAGASSDGAIQTPTTLTALAWTDLTATGDGCAHAVYPGKVSNKTGRTGGRLWLQWFLPQVHVISQTRARNNALLLVTVLQMVHVEERSAGLAVAWATWLISVAILCWAVLIKDAPKGFEDIHESAAFGMVVLAKDLAAVLEADLVADDTENDGSVRVFESFRDPSSDCCAAFPAGCPRCQLLLRRVPATLFRMQETMCVSYRWQRQVRAVVRPQSHGPLASSSGVRNQVVGINMTHWQRSELLAAILRSSCTYVWLDVLSIPAALRPAKGSRLWELSEKLMSRMMAVYSAAASTLVLLSNEKEGERYCQRAWTMQEYCGARALDVVCQSGSNIQTALAPRTAVQSIRKILTEFVVSGRRRLAAFHAEEVDRYQELRQYVVKSMTKAVPLWIRIIRGTDSLIEAAAYRAGLYASVVETVSCSESVDFVRALVPVLLNTSVQNMEELRVLVRVSSSKCPRGSAGADAMENARRLLGMAEGSLIFAEGSIP